MGQLLNLFHLLLICSLTLSLVNCQSSFPCPDPEAISPCKCKLDEVTQLMTLDCSTVQSTQQLETVFSADFPFLNYEVFRMVNYPDTPSPVDALPAGLFRNVTFRSIYIMCAQISSLGENVFEKSYDVLRSIRIQKALLKSFPFNQLPSFTVLTSIVLDYNDITNMADINSETLQYLSIPYNPHLYFSQNAFLNAPNIRQIELTRAGQLAIPTDIFATSYNVEYINLAQNNLTIIETNSINLPNNTLKYLDFRYNNINLFQPGAIQGLHPACAMYFMFNSITTLEEEVWRPIFEVVAQTDKTEQINLSDNPLDCGCSMAWLMLNGTLLKEISQFSACANGGPNIPELDPIFYSVNC